MMLTKRPGWIRVYHRFLSENANSSIISSIEAILGADNVMKDDIEAYRTDWLRMYKKGSVVCFPKSTSQLSKLLAFCNLEKVKVVPQGGNTGLVGGCVPLHDNEIIVSMRKMNKILEIDEESSALVCEAGCILEELEYAVNKSGFTIPLDLGSKGSCTIGGNVSTNAGGLRLMKYGSLHGNVLGGFCRQLPNSFRYVLVTGLEVVLADGRVLNMNRKLRKDNSGYQLNHLFIGSEGTLGTLHCIIFGTSNVSIAW